MTTTHAMRTELEGTANTFESISDLYSVKNVYCVLYIHYSVKSVVYILLLRELTRSPCCLGLRGCCAGRAPSPHLADQLAFQCGLRGPQDLLDTAEFNATVT